MNRDQMIQDIHGLASTDIQGELVPASRCDEAHKLTDAPKFEEFLCVHIQIRNFEQFLHFLGHIFIECYELGYNRGQSDSEVSKLMGIYNIPSPDKEGKNNGKS